MGVTPLFDTDTGNPAGTKIDFRVNTINGDQGVVIDAETSRILDIDMATIGDGYDVAIKAQLTPLVDALIKEELTDAYNQKVQDTILQKDSTKDSIDQKIEKLTGEVVTL